MDVQIHLAVDTGRTSLCCSPLSVLRSCQPNASVCTTEVKEAIQFNFLVVQVLIAVGRDACTNKIGLDKAGVKVNPK